MNKDLLYYYDYTTPIGLLTIGSIQNDIVFCQFEKYKGEGIYQENQCLKEASQQLNEYFSKQRKVFDLHYRYLTGTPFQQKVWQTLLTIPYGQTASYQDIAYRIGSPKAYRAVGNANHHNPIVLFIPCHRVITSSHYIGGYGGGIDKKEFLLHFEMGEEYDIKK